MSKPSPRLRAAQDLWQQARWRESEAVLDALPPQEMRGEALLLKARLLVLRDPAAAVALAGSMQHGRERSHFRAEAEIVWGNALSRIGEYEEAEEHLAKAEADSGGDADLLAKVALYRSVSLMLQSRIDRIEPLLPAIAGAHNPDIRAQGAAMYAVLLRHREYYRAQIPVLVQALVELRARESPNLGGLQHPAHARRGRRRVLGTDARDDGGGALRARAVARRHRGVAFLHQPRVELVVRARGRFIHGVPVSQARGRVSGARRAARPQSRRPRAPGARARRAAMGRAGDEPSRRTLRRVAWEAQRDERDDSSSRWRSGRTLRAHRSHQASEYVARFQMFHQRLSSANTRRHNRVDRALVSGTKGVVSAALGKLNEAVRALEECYEIYDEIGYDWRAGKAALELAAVSGDQRHLENARKKLARYERSWLAASYREAAERLGVANVVPGVRLTPAQWQVFHLLADGFSLGEVAAHLGRSLNTIRNHAGAIYTALGVHSQKELRARVRPELAKGIRSPKSTTPA